MKSVFTASKIVTGVLSVMMCCNGFAQGSKTEKKPAQNKADSGYTLEQAMSDSAQLSTISFSGLAFITGSAGADTFMPPGKVADFFGFQYMRDVDTAGYGHNTQFLSRVANAVLSILTDEQKQKLVVLAKEQAPLYTLIAYNRFPVMHAFRQSLEERSGLNQSAVAEYVSKMYRTDADLSYNRAVVTGGIIASFTGEQKAFFEKMQFNNFNTWPDVPEDEELKRGLTNTEFVAVMTYASELFSWYKGSIDADVYFCPERHGTYFGGFFMKDYAAMNNPDYFISTAVTGDRGKEFLSILDADQRKLIEDIIPEQKTSLQEIAQIRTGVSQELRKAITGETIDRQKVYDLIERYGYLDGQVSSLYAVRFSQVRASLTADQMNALVKLRDLDAVPEGAYLFSTEIPIPQIPDTGYLFGEGPVPDEAGTYPVPTGFGAETAKGVKE